MVAYQPELALLYTRYILMNGQHMQPPIQDQSLKKSTNIYIYVYILINHQFTGFIWRISFYNINFTKSFILT